MGERRRRHRLRLLLLAALGCGHTSEPPPSPQASAAPAPSPSAPTRAEPASASPSSASSQSIVGPAPADPRGLEQVEGRFDIDRIAGGKRFQGSWLHRNDGESLVLSYRPIPEYFAYVEKRVVVSGERYQPDGQAIAGPHFRVESMRLAEGETARATIPTALPVPPMVPTGPALERREDRWVQVVGTVNRARERQPDSDWEDVVVTLDDGTEVRVRESHWVAERLYGPLAGQRATITGRLLRDPEGHWRLGAATATCEGEVDGCGMTVQPLLRR